MTVSRVINVSRVSRMTRQGRKFQFRALVVMGSGNGSAGLGVGKGLTTRAALRDAKREAMREVVVLSLAPWGGLYHDVMGKCNNTKVLFKSGRPRPNAPHGRLLRAGPVVQAVCDCFGISTGTTKVIGRRNPYTVVQAVFRGLGKHRSPEELAEEAGRRVLNLGDGRPAPGLTPALAPRLP